MSRRILLSEEDGDDSNDDVIVRRGSLRRLSVRASHYWGSQRASLDRIPLIPSSQRNTVTSLPPRPPPIYQPQPHQLIAVCFNHMAGRQCEHCQQLNQQYGGNKETLESSPDSGHTLAHEQHQQHRESSRSDSEPEAKPQDGGEKGEKEGPSAPAGFWDKRLSKLRLEVFGGWARTSELSGSL